MDSCGCDGDSVFEAAGKGCCKLTIICKSEQMTIAKPKRHPSSGIILRKTTKAFIPGSNILEFETDDSRTVREIMRDKWLANSAFDPYRNEADFQEILARLTTGIQ